MIDEKKLIEDIDNNVVGLTNIQIMQIADIINSQPPADQWIPCSERLPDKDGWYWVTEDKPYSGVTPLACFNTETGRFSRPFSYSEVVAWMPSNMPEPYKGAE